MSLRRWLPLVLLISAGCRPRTEIMLGVVTDLRAPDLLDNVHLSIKRDGELVQDVDWPIPGSRTGLFILPGSYGLFSSDGSTPRIEVVITGTKGASGKKIVERKALVSLLSDKTLFMRMGLVAGCTSKFDCAEGLTCIEGECKDAFVDPRTLPDFQDELITHVTCNSGTTFISTDTQLAMPTLGGMTCQPGGKCEEGTCYLPPPPDSDLGSAPDLQTPQVPWVQQVVPTSQALRAVWGTSDGKDVFAVGDQGTILHATGGSSNTAVAWVSESFADPTVGDLVGVFGFAADDVWAVSATGVVLRRGPLGWTRPQVTVPADRLTAVWGSGPGDVWTLGKSGSILTAIRWNNVELQPHALPQVGDLNAVWGTASNDVWAVGNGLSIIHFDGSTWDQQVVPGGNPGFRDFFGVWASPLNVYAVGKDANGKMLLYHFRPGAPLGAAGTGADNSFPLRGVWGRNDSDLYAVGDNGVVLRSTGDDVWRVEMTPSNRPLAAVFGATSGSETYAVGEAGVVLYSSAPATHDGGVLADAGVPVDMMLPADLMSVDLAPICFGKGDCPDVFGIECCNGQCIDTNADPLNCGACNSPCSAPNMCVGTICMPPPDDSGVATDAAQCPQPACTPTDSDDGGVPISCNCTSNCFGNTYALDCLNTTCQCFINGSATGVAFANNMVCMTPVTAEQTFHSTCGFP